MSDERGDPHQILKQGRISALSSKYRLAKNRVNFTNRKEFRSLEKTWKKYWSKYRESVRENSADFRYISKAEGPMSKQFLSRLFIKSHQLGYKISKRIHSEKEGFLDEFNTILNIAGSTLRDFFEIHYPLPSSEDYNYGKISKEHVKPIHEGLPSLDFAEIIRSHLQELSFIMFKHNAPLSKIQNYVISFLLDTMNVCDWIYAGGRPGVNSKSKEESTKYIPRGKYKQPSDLDKVLSKYKNIIVNEHFVIGRKLAVRDEINNYYKSLNDNKNNQRDSNGKNNDITQNNHSDLTDQESSETDEDPVYRFLKDQKIPEKYHRFFNQDSIDTLISKRHTVARVKGSQFHELVLAGLPSPFDLKEAIRNGDRFLQYKHYLNDDILVIAEVGMSNSQNKGKADLIILKKIPGDLWLPIYVFDIKTKFAYEWDFVGKESRSNKNRITPDFTIKLNELPDEDWELLSQRDLTKTEKLQLKKYTKIILDNVQNIIGRKFTQDYLSDYKLGYGIIRVAPTDKVENWPNWQSIILEIIDQIVQQTIESSNPKNPSQGFHFYPKSTIFVPKDAYNKVSVIIGQAANLGTKHLEPQGIIEYSKEKLKPVEKNEPNKEGEKPKQFTLYIYADSATSAGTSAAWIAAYHHLIPFVLKKHRAKQICIVDLSGTLQKFKENRLRVGDKQLTEQILAQVDILSIQDFKKSDKIKKYGVFIFSGWDYYKLQRSTTAQQFQQSTIESDQMLELIEQIPNGSHAYWMEKANHSEFHSRVYKKRSIKPPSLRLNYESIFSNVILNLPTPPAKAHHKNPSYESQRVILYWNGKNTYRNKPSERPAIREEIASIISLRGHTSKFHNKRPAKRISKSDRRLLNNKNLQKEIINQAYDLVQWLAKIKWPETKYDNLVNHKIDLDTIEPQFMKKFNKSNFHNSTIKSKLNLHYKVAKISSTQIPKIHITDPMIRKIQNRFRKVKKRASFYPVNPSLLQLKSSDRLNSSNRVFSKKDTGPVEPGKSDRSTTFGTLERFEIQRLDAWVSHFLNKNEEKYKVQKKEKLNLVNDRGWLELTDLCTEIKVAIEAGQGCYTIGKIIERWEIETTTFPDSLLDEIHRLQYLTYFRYIKNNPIVSEIVRNNSDIFRYIGNTNYLIILSMLGFFKYIPKYLLRSLWWKLVPYTLTMLGFVPIAYEVPLTRYQTNIVWNKVYHWMKFHYTERELLPHQFQAPQISHITQIHRGSKVQNNLINGYFVSKDRYGVLHLDGLGEILVDLPSRNYFGPSDFPYLRVINPKTIEDQIDVFSNPRSYLTHELQVMIFSYENANHIFCQDETTKFWYLIGEIQFLLSVSERNTSSKIKEKNMNKQVVLVKQKRLILINDPLFKVDHIEHFKIRKSNYDTKYFTTIIDDFTELDITKDEILTEEGFNIPEIESDEVGIKFSFNYGKGFILAKIYTKDQLNSSDDSIVSDDPLDVMESSDVHEMIEFLRRLKSAYYEIEDQNYYIDINNNIDWGGWIHLKHLVNSNRSIDPVIFPRDVKLFLNKYLELLYYNEDKIIKAIFNLYHDNKNCPICSLEFDRVLQSVRKARKQYGYVQDSEIDHIGCFYLKLQNEDELVDKIVSVEVMETILSFEDIKNTEEMYDIFTKSVFINKKEDFAVTCTLDFDDNDIAGEDYWSRRVARETSNNELTWFPRGSDYIGTETYIIESIFKTAETVPSRIITYLHPASGNKRKITIPGDADPCIKITNFTTKLDTESASYEGMGMFEEHPDIIELREEIEDHYPCSSPLHEDAGDNEEEHLVLDELILNLPTKVYGKFSVELVYKTLSGQYLADHPTVEFDDWSSLYSWIDTSVVDELAKNGLGQAITILEVEFGEKFPSVFQEDIFDALERIVRDFNKWMDNTIKKYQDKIAYFDFDDEIIADDEDGEEYDVLEEIIKIESSVEENNWIDKIVWIYNIYKFMQKLNMEISEINGTSKFQIQLHEAVLSLREGQPKEASKRFQSAFENDLLMKQDWELLSKKRFEYRFKQETGNYDGEYEFQLFDLGTLLNYLGLSNWNQSNYYDALEHFKLSYDERKGQEIVHYKDLTETIENIGSLYYYFNDPDTSLYYYDQAFDMLRENDFSDSIQITRIYLNIGKSYLVMEKIDKAREYVRKAREYVTGENQSMILEIQLLRAEIYQQEGNLQNCVTELKSSLHNTAAQSNLIQLTYIQYKLILYYNALEYYHEIPPLLESLYSISNSYPTELDYKIKHSMALIVTSLAQGNFMISKDIHEMVSIASTGIFTHELTLNAILLFTKYIIHTFDHPDIDIVGFKESANQTDVRDFLGLHSTFPVISLIQLLTKSIINLFSSELQSLHDNLNQLSNKILIHQENQFITKMKLFLNICNTQLPDFNKYELKEAISNLVDDLLYNSIKHIMWTGIIYTEEK